MIDQVDYYEEYHFALLDDDGPYFHYFGPELTQTLGEDHTSELLENEIDGLMGNLIGFYPKVIQQRSPQT